MKCNSPAGSVWDEDYNVFSYGVNIGLGCGGLADTDVLPEATTTSQAQPPELRSLPVSAGAEISPDYSATSTMSMPELKARAIAIAASDGDPEPSSIEVATAPRAQAAAAVTPALQFVETPEQEQWLSESTYAVVLHGHFESASTPSGAASEEEPQAKPYTTLSLVLDAKTGAVTAFNLSEPGQRQPTIDELGDVRTP